MTDSPTYQCKSGGIPVVDTAGPYCIVQGGAKRMATCCGDAPVNFHPDCYSWCHTPLPPYNGLDPSFQIIRKFMRCLEEGQGPRYTPSMMCLNGTAETQPQPSSSTSTSVEMPTSSASTVPTSASVTPSGTQPAVPTYTGTGSRSFGPGVRIAAGLVLLQLVFGLV